MVTLTTATRTEVTLTIHGGHLSLDNGAYAPWTYFNDLAKAVGADVDYGNYYGDDRITIDASELPIVEELLRDNKMLYKVEGRDSAWVNVCTEHVANRLRQPWQN